MLILHNKAGFLPASIYYDISSQPPASLNQFTIIFAEVTIRFKNKIDYIT